MHAIRTEMIAPPLAVRNAWRLGGFTANGIPNRIFIERSEVGILTVAFCGLSIISTGLGILPIDSVGMVIEEGLAILTALLL